MIDKETLQKLKEASAKATKGPIEVKTSVYPGMLRIVGFSFGIDVVLTATDLNMQDFVQRNNDAIFIALARNHIDELIDLYEFTKQACEQYTCQVGIHRAEIEDLKKALKNAEKK